MAHSDQRYANHTEHTPHNATPLRYTTHTPPREGSIDAIRTGFLLKDGTPTSPSPQIREVLMGFTSGDTAVGGLSPDQRIHILGQCTDLNILHWTLALVNANPTEAHNSPTRVHPGIPWEDTYTFSQPLPNLEEAQALPIRDPRHLHDPTLGGAPP